MGINWHTCPDCHGRGVVEGYCYNGSTEHECKACDGLGKRELWPPDRGVHWHLLHPKCAGCGRVMPDNSWPLCEACEAQEAREAEAAAMQAAYPDDPYDTQEWQELLEEEDFRT